MVGITLTIGGLSMTKMCSKCGGVKEADCFYKDKTKADGLNSYCKECSRSYKQDWYNEKKDNTNGLYKTWENIKLAGVCNKWEDFDAFYEWAEPRHEEGLKLCRKDTNKPFGPDNCKFTSNMYGIKESNVSKLSMKAARKIREIYYNTNTTQKEIAEEYDVHPTAIWRIVHNKTWKEDPSD